MKKLHMMLRIIPHAHFTFMSKSLIFFRLHLESALTTPRRDCSLTIVNMRRVVDHFSELQPQTDTGTGDQ